MRDLLLSSEHIHCLYAMAAMAVGHHTFETCVAGVLLLQLCHWRRKSSFFCPSLTVKLASNTSISHHPTSVSETNLRGKGKYASSILDIHLLLLSISLSPQGRQQMSSFIKYSDGDVCLGLLSLSQKIARLTVVFLLFLFDLK